MPITKMEVIEQIDGLLGQFTELMSKAEYDDCSDIPKPLRIELVTRAQALIARFAPLGSSYAVNVEQMAKKNPPLSHSHMFFKEIQGILSALRKDYEAGYMNKIEELIHADLFSDFLEMAEHLLEEGYKDPAAVLVGGVLEEHLRKLSDKHGISAAQGGHPKKADTLNSELAGSSAYSKLDQKNVTAWLDLRNKAAHGNYGEYVPGQVRLLIQSVRDFLTRVPA
jgi:hypothetical protein